MAQAETNKTNKKKNIVIINGVEYYRIKRKVGDKQKDFYGNGLPPIFVPSTELVEEAS